MPKRVLIPAVIAVTAFVLDQPAGGIRNLQVSENEAESCKR